MNAIPYDVAREPSALRAMRLWKSMPQIPGAEYPGLGAAYRFWRDAAVLRQIEAASDDAPCAHGDEPDDCPLCNPR